MGFSYSFHLSNKSNALSNTNKVKQASRHNLRGYKSNSYNKEQIVVLKGTDNILADVRQVYDDEFTEALQKYNKKVRADRQIDNYLEHVSNSRADVAAEIIIQVGDMDFWANIAQKDRKCMDAVFEAQIEALTKECKGFKIASAVIHYDEASPHLHIVGVPVADGYKKGMQKQVAKTKVFTKETLAELQDTMRVAAANSIEQLTLDGITPIFKGAIIKPKEKGRNKDIPKRSIAEFKQLQEAANQELMLLDMAAAEKKTELAEQKTELNTVRTDLGRLEHIKEKVLDADSYIPSNTIYPYIRKDGEFGELMNLPGLEREKEKLLQEIEEARQQLVDINNILNNANLIVSAYQCNEFLDKINEYAKSLSLTVKEQIAFEDMDPIKMQKAFEQSKYMHNQLNDGDKFRELIRMVKQYNNMLDKPTSLEDMARKLKGSSLSINRNVGRSR